MSTVREKLIERGVQNLKEFGYSNCNKSNILTDPIYKEFFESMLQDTKNSSAPGVKDAVLVLLGEVK